MSGHIRNARGSVRPYILGHLGLPDFLQEVFGAEDMERHDMGPESAHVELAIGDSVVVVEAGKLPDSFIPTRASVYAYVPDVDAAYERALAAGATSISKPDDKHYSERSAAIEDASATPGISRRSSLDARLLNQNAQRPSDGWRKLPLARRALGTGVSRSRGDGSSDPPHRSPDVRLAMNAMEARRRIFP